MIKIKTLAIIDRIAVEDDKATFTLAPLKFIEGNSELATHKIDICLRVGSASDVYMRDQFIKNKPIEINFSGIPDNIK